MGWLLHRERQRKDHPIPHPAAPASRYRSHPAILCQARTYLLAVRLPDPLCEAGPDGGDQHPALSDNGRSHSPILMA